MTFLVHSLSIKVRKFGTTGGTLTPLLREGICVVFFFDVFVLVSSVLSFDVGTCNPQLVQQFL